MGRCPTASSRSTGWATCTAGWCQVGRVRAIGDHDDVDATAQQVGGEGVPQGVRRDERLTVLVDQVGVEGDLVDDLVDCAGGQAVAAAVEEQRRGVAAGVCVGF